jgi:hypothetical protein
MRIRSIRVVVLFAFMTLIMTSAAFAQLRISVTFGPPALPVYEQPVCPGEGYIWTPGYWAWDDDDGDYYWVPGTWVLAPEVGFLWTPPYWAWVDGGFVFYEGYWGPEVGFYGGINYGFGYFGEGFEGGRWQGSQFYYNRSVTNVNVTNIRNVYNTTVVNNTTTVNRVSYNGGNGGVNARPTPQQEAAMHERHLPPATAQTQQVQAARRNPELRASANRGKPPIAATARPGTLSGQGVVAARQAGAPYNPPANRGAGRSRPDNGRPATAVHPNDLPPMEHPSPPNNGASKMDKKYQQEQEKLQAKQEQDRQKLQQRQEKEHQRLAQQNADANKRQQMEERHQQQTQQLQQRHEEQRQTLQQQHRPPEQQQPAERNGSKPPRAGP